MSELSNREQYRIQQNGVKKWRMSAMRWVCAMSSLAGVLLLREVPYFQSSTETWANNLRVAIAGSLFAILVIISELAGRRSRYAVVQCACGLSVLLFLCTLLLFELLIRIA